MFSCTKFQWVQSFIKLCLVKRGKARVKTYFALLSKIASAVGVRLRSFRKEPQYRPFGLVPWRVKVNATLWISYLLQNKKASNLPPPLDRKSPNQYLAEYFNSKSVTEVWQTNRSTRNIFAGGVDIPRGLAYTISGSWCINITSKIRDFQTGGQLQPS